MPENARWSTISKNAKDARIGVMIDDAMREVEAKNASIKGALPKVFGKESIDRGMHSGLIDLFYNLKLDGPASDLDLIGRVMNTILVNWLQLGVIYASIVVLLRYLRASFLEVALHYYLK